jgi:regulator of cell morphogenesis and NO signaling
LSNFLPKVKDLRAQKFYWWVILSRLWRLVSSEKILGFTASSSYFWSMLHKILHELLEENYSYASVLHWCGIDAFDYLGETLGDVCRIKNVNTRNVEEALLQVHRKSEFSFARLQKMAPSEMCHYLTQTHHHYSQRMLPVIEHHIQQTVIEYHKHYPQLLLLDKIFATFKEDFLKHIRYENETVFVYIKKLEKFTVRFQHTILLELKDFSMGDFIIKHHHDDDDMFNIRKLLDNYAVTCDDHLAYKVLMHELKTFESDLKAHSLIEEDMLIPRAIKMEEKLHRKIAEKISLN